MTTSGGGGEPELPNMRLNRPPCPEMLLLLFPASFAVGVVFRSSGVKSVCRRFVSGRVDYKYDIDKADKKDQV